MSILKHLLISLLLLVMSNNLIYAQEDKSRIMAATDVETLQRIAKDATLKFTASKAEAIKKAEANNWIVRKTFSDGSMIELMYLDAKGNPVYYKTDNVDAAVSIGTNRVNSGGSMGLSLDGNGFVAGEWDGGAVRVGHEQFSGRVTQTDGATSLSDHATHVCGTIAGDGTGNASAKGMAPLATVNAHDWNSDNSEMATAAANGLLISNHSYGIITGWYNDGITWYWFGDNSLSTTEDDDFGRYTYDAREWDNIAVAAPYYLIVKSAGNDRNDTAPPSGTNYEYANGTVSNTSTDPHPDDCNGGTGYDCISSAGNAKNILTVGAVNDVVGGYSSPGGVSMSSFSGWGPTDDGRIKPDISGNGVGLTSSTAGSNTSYSSYSGTSMSSPSVTGSLLLLQEHYENTKGSGYYMRAATLKALAIHTADEAGAADGPDYEYGWGLMNTATAAQVISDNGTSVEHIDEPILGNNTTFTKTVTATGSEPLVVTIAWTDPTGNYINGFDVGTSVLLNDLDVRISDGTTTYTPYILDPAFPSNAATTGDNFRDNVEKIVIPNPTTGATYTITVSHKNTLTNNSQHFALIVTGNQTSNTTTYCSGTTTLIANSGSFSDGSGTSDYADNSDCKWLIQPTNAASITLNFSAFDTENGNDVVSIYDGTTTGATLLGTFSGSSIPTSITSSGGAMLVHFTSNSSTVASGWDASYTAVITGPCSGTTTLTTPSGSFSDGSGTSNYPNNSDCKWLIQPTGATSITLNFSTFDTESNYDYVRVYNGATTSDPLLGTFSGSSIPASITAFGGTMLVHFTSDGSVTRAGWDASYTSVTGGAYCNGTTTLTTASGTFSDGSTTNNYGNNSDCKWLIQPTGAASILLNFSAFDTESNNDVVNVYDGTTTSDPLIGTFSGSSIPASVNSTGGAMLVHFVSNGSTTAAGWDASYISATGGTYCSGTTILSTPSGTFSDGSGTNNYGTNTDCKWLIQPGGSDPITLSFTALDTESNNDVVKVYDGATTSANLLGTFSGLSIPSSVVGTGSSMLVHFTSDGSVSRSGWDAVYNTTVGNYCNGITSMTAASDSFSDGSGTDDYSDNSDCKWLIQPIGAAAVTLTFSAFDTENSNDVVSVYDGSTTNATLLGTFSGSTIPTSISSTGGSMLVHFTSDGSNVASGWDASYTSVTTSPYCGGTTVLGASSGSFSDGSGTNNYFGNSDCKWLIQPTVGAASITLNFSSFETEPTFDHVRVYDGTATSATLIGDFSGSSLPSSVTGTGGAMLVHFISDANVTKAGWDASYTSTPAAYCNGTTTLRTSSGSFSDGSGAGNYVDNSDCKWLIQPTTGATSIVLNFSAFDTESSNDLVSIYDGTATTDPLLGTFSGSTIPASISSTGGAMLVHFTSNGSTTAQGWDASYTSVTSGTYCSGTTVLTAASGSFSDGSGTNDYVDNTNCQWLIQPTGATSITLSFSSFDIESGYDYVRIYDGTTINAPLLKTFSGNSLPASITTVGGSMLVSFTSDGSITEAGWDASYVSNSGSTCPNPTTPVTLPFFEGFENDNGIHVGSQNVVCDPTYKWDFETDNQTNGRANIGTDAYTSNTGGGAATLDGAVDVITQRNIFILTLNLNNYITSSDLELSFDFVDHGDEPNSEDRIFIRGSEADSWIEIYDWSVLNLSNFVSVIGLDIDAALSAAGQTVSNTFQVKFSQKDNYSAPTDGLTIDNISITGGGGPAVTCGTPIGISTNNVTTTSADFSWNSVTLAVSYDIEWRAVGATTWNQANSTTTTFSLSNLTPGTSYEWRIRTNCGSITSLWSAAQTFTTLSLTACNTPTGLSTSNVTTTSADFSWNSVTSAVSYDIEWRVVGATTWNQANTTTTTFSLSNLIPGTSYEWHVRTNCSGVTSAWSSSQTFTTINTNYLIVNPPTVNVPTANAGGVTINVTSNVTWAIINSDSWITLSNTSGANNGIFTIDYAANLSATSRTATIMVVGGGMVVTVTLTQSGSNSPWTVTPTSNTHIVTALSTMTSALNGAPIQAGDYVGFFYNDNGTHHCAGYGQWTGSDIAMTVYGDDPNSIAKDGMAVGEVFQVKVWSAANQQETDVYATYAAVAPPLITHTDTFAVGGRSQLNDIRTDAIFNLILSPGWQIVSSYVIPNDPVMDNLCIDIANNMIITKNDAGGIYLPSLSINTVGNWITPEGYTIKMSAADTLTFIGQKADPTTPMSLSAGWSTIGYLRDTPMPIYQALASITNDIVIVKDDLGGTYIPNLGINTITNMVPGKGYDIKLTNGTSLTYPAFGGGAVVLNKNSKSTVHYAALTSTGANATMIITKKIADKVLTNGDELAIFSPDGILCGAAVYEGKNFAITIWGDDAATNLKEGILDGEDYYFRYWDSETDTEIPLNQVTYDEGNGQYGVNAIAKVGALSLATSTKPLNTIYTITCFPNPVKSQVNFTIDIKENADVIIEIMDLQGRILDRVTNNTLMKGTHTFQYDVRHLADGMYIYQVRTSQGTHTDKFIIHKD